MFVAAHQANWNLPAVIGQYLGVKGSVLFRRRKNPYLETVIEHWRNQMPCGFIDVDDRVAACQMTEAVNRLFESWTRERPEQWLSTARRWPREMLSSETSANARLENVEARRL